VFIHLLCCTLQALLMDDVLDEGGYKEDSAPQQFEVAEGSFVLLLPSGGCSTGVILVYVGLGLNRIAPQQFEVAEGSFVLVLPLDGCSTGRTPCVCWFGVEQDRTAAV
jgi:hypothetical protein